MKCLVGKKIKLVKFDERFVTPEYINWLNDFDVNKYLDTGRLPVHSNSIVIPKDEKNLMFAIMTNVYFENESIKLDNEFMKYIGTCSLHRIDWISRKAEIGYCLGDKKYWQQGLITEVIGLLIEYGFCRLNLNKIVAGVVDGNIGSQRALEKNGFNHYGNEPQDYYLNGKYLDTKKFCLFKKEYLK